MKTTCAPRCFLVLDVHGRFVMCIEAAGSHNALRSVRPFGRKFGQRFGAAVVEKKPVNASGEPWSRKTWGDLARRSSKSEAGDACLHDARAAPGGLSAVAQRAKAEAEGEAGLFDN